MSRSEQERFADILVAIQRCQQYAPHLHSDDLASMAYDAVLRNLAVIVSPSGHYHAKPDKPCLMFRGHQSQGCATSSCTSTSE